MYERLATAYGRFRARAVARSRVLSKTQDRIAKELLVAELSAKRRLLDIAALCGLPLRQFIDAFRQTIGVPAFRWLRTYRIERAKEPLRGTSLSLASVAAACGFADQRPFTRAFSSTTGTTSRSWRRASGA
ncbi:helix-turn-helix domain-containing protein [Paraburkholderia dipogonis]|uniref:helix-turn-helix domain-containing protein n=1 Tax=Paraburkholderia dipogonis TaxID=1211383 RepID=UPI0038B93E29